MRILAIETSCDETAAAVVEDGRAHPLERRLDPGRAPRALRRRGAGAGLAPPPREHLPGDRPGDARRRASAFAELDAVAVTQGPGLIGSLLVGVQAAKGIAFVHGKPLVPVHHIAGHIQAPFLAHGEIPLPALALVVSGGHTHLYEVPERGRLPCCAAARATTRPARPSTRWPSSSASAIRAGPVIDRLSQGANDRAHGVHGRARSRTAAATSRSAASRPRCSTTCGARASRPWPIRRTCPDEIRDLVASFQRAVVTALLRRLKSGGRGAAADAACC